MGNNGSLQGLAEDLVQKAWMDGYMVGSPTSVLIRHAVDKGGWSNVPDRCKPGGLINSLSDKDREKVKELKAKHFNHRQK